MTPYRARSLVLLPLVLAFACDDVDDSDLGADALVYPADEDNDFALDGDELSAGPTPQAAGVGFGRFLFDKETFDGNDRTCRTCHTKQTGALSPEQVQEAFADDPDGPLFRALDSDDGTGSSYDRLLADATVFVGVDLPDGWSLVDDPAATSVTLVRGIPTTNNTPALDPVLMADGRNASLQEQALGAVNAHAEPGRQPTAEELDAIAAFQQTNQFFSDNTLRKWARGTGPAPELPPGQTESEIRGREWFVPSVEGICGHCHAGPMLNETSEFLLLPDPPGTRFQSAFVSELNKAGNDLIAFEVDNGDGTSTIIETPDPGRALVTGDPAHVNLFKIPTLWGVADTAPYFHDNSAATLEDVAQHYSDYFDIIGLGPMTEQEQADVVAYMELL